MPLTVARLFLASSETIDLSFDESVFLCLYSVCNCAAGSVCPSISRWLAVDDREKPAGIRVQGLKGQVFDPKKTCSLMNRVTPVAGLRGTIQDGLEAPVLILSSAEPAVRLRCPTYI